VPPAARQAFRSVPLVLLSSLVFCLPNGGFAQDPSPDVPLGDPVYASLDRWDARGWLAAPLSGIRPYSRRYVAARLDAIYRLDDREGLLSVTERGMLARHRAEFAQELARLKAPAPAGRPDVWSRVRGGGSLVAWDTPRSFGGLDVLFRQDLIAVRGGRRPRETVSQTYLGGIARGEYRSRIGFLLRHYEAREWSDRRRATRADVMAGPVEKVQLKGNTVDFREATAQLVVATDWFDAELGKGRMDWGPAPGANLLLTANTTPYAYARLRTAYGRVRYVHVLGFLEPRPGVIDSSRTRIDNGHVRTFPRRKQLSAHRLEVDLPRRVVLGLQESVIYGDRAPELLYATPVTLLAAAQSYLGDTDNLLMGMDLTARPFPGLRVYAALLFDDMVKFDPDAFANKFGLQLGLQWVDPVGWRDSDLRVDYARIEPFVYSHNYDINTYEHFDALLGCPIGPNADRVVVRLAHRFTPALSAAVSLGQERQGENPVAEDGSVTNVGGDAALGRRPGDARTRDFLAGDVERERTVDLLLDWEPVRDLRFRAGYRGTWAANVRLADGSRGNARGHRWSVGAAYHFR
jgi:hypothetical protein